MRALVVLAMLAGCADERVLSGPCAGDCTPRVHPDGFLDPNNAAFHGKELQRHDWNFALCAGCHGADFSGGAAKVSCLGCHAQGPTACITCHGSGPTSNAHLAHAAKQVACAECHVVPATWDADGHILHDGKAITTPPQVPFGALAQTPTPDRKGPATWDGATCTNVYCHGDAFAAGGTTTQPRWDDPSPATCNRCHGDPPPSHARTDCATCHPPSAPHVDGIVQVGRTSGCSGCHGSAQSPAPPVDLSGNTFTTAIGVGAHQTHLNSRISSPVPCATCHQVPATVDAPGHIDSPAPAEVVASLGWDRDAQTCGTSGCHGAARPVWTSTGQVYCGTCHGIPPVTPSHTPAMTLTSCVTCHASSVDAFGNILVVNGTSTHANGVVDAN